MKIMVVDDERLVLDTIIKLVKKVVPEAETIGLISPVEAFDYLTENPVDIALLDIHMEGMIGLELAVKCKECCPKINIIFVTGYSQYALDALKLHASGYLMKPVRDEDLKKELENLRHPLQVDTKSRVRVQTFGHFEIFVAGDPLQFPRSKCKECLAYLIDRKGASVTPKAISAILWEDKPYDRHIQKHTQMILWEMMKRLKEIGIQDIVVKKFNSMSVDINKIECDYYRAISGDMQELNSFSGEYMTQYSWAEFTIGELIQKLNKR